MLGISPQRSTWPADAPRFQPLADVADAVEARPQATAGLDLTAAIAWLGRMGVVADRRTCPDLLGQLNLALTQPVDRIICTALAGESSLRHSAAVAARFPIDVVGGVTFLRQILPGATAMIAIEAGAPQSWTRGLRQACAAEKIRIVEMINDYPQTDPTLMLYSLLKRRKLRPGNLPPQQRAVVVDAAAAMAIGQAMKGLPMTHVPVLLHDHAKGQSHSRWVPLDTKLGDLLEHLEIDRQLAVLRRGDLLRDMRVTCDTTLGGGELAIHIIRGEKILPAETCIRCGWCADICPTRVQPAAVLDAAQQNDPPAAAQAGIHACIQCGLCSHVCPSSLPLLEAIRMMGNLKT